jgi:lipopolysaccharide export system permease protein
MQFLWKYLEDLVGKGLETIVLIEFFTYASAHLITMALPLAVLLASIMTMGNLGENYELASLKASGISLQRILLPLIILSVGISLLAFLFSNYVAPVANLKLTSLIYDITNQKPALNIKEGIYYDEISGYVLRVSKKEKDGKTVKNIFIYDHTENRGNVKMIFAETGFLDMTTDKNFLLVKLNNGVSYEEIKPSKPNALNKPFIRTSFKEELIRMDLSDFKMSRTKEELFKENYKMMNVFQLDQTIDSIHKEIEYRLSDFERQVLRNLGINHSLSANTGLKFWYPENFNGDVLSLFSKTEQGRILDNSLNIIRGNINYADASLNDYKARNYSIVRSKMEWHGRFTLSIACLVLFFIGAPLGAIVRKGGLGMPVVLSVLFFLAYHIVSTTGEKFAKEEVWPPFQGMWFSTFIFLPIGFFLTVKATTDSKLFEADYYLSFFKRFITKK